MWWIVDSIAIGIQKAALSLDESLDIRTPPLTIRSSPLPTDARSNDDNAE